MSPRYSEDLDLDVLGGSIDTLKKNGYKILKDPSFLRSLLTYGITGLELSDMEKAKHTATTQRLRLRLVTESGEKFPTKIEFSRRPIAAHDKYIFEPINPAIAANLKRLSFSCYHYVALSAMTQKVRALAGRTETQARDVFDLYMLFLGGKCDPSLLSEQTSITERLAAKRALETLDYESYRGHVVDYLEISFRDLYGTLEQWNLMTQKVKELLK